MDNREYGVRCGPGTFTITHWGAPTIAEMAAGGNPKNITRIFDVFDAAGSGLVNYSAWLDPAAVEDTTWTRVKHLFR